MGTEYAIEKIIGLSFCKSCR